VYENDDVVAFEDINPQAPTHLLVIPRDHIESVNDLGDEHAEIAGKIMNACREIAESNGFAEAGYRVVINCGADGGQVVPHLHAHLLAGRGLSWPPG
jgi:histidine triad (HIT) family protein